MYINVELLMQWDGKVFIELMWNNFKLKHTYFIILNKLNNIY